jgi:hypothetical protein
MPFALALLMSPAVVNLRMDWAFCNCALPPFMKILWVLNSLQDRERIETGGSRSGVASHLTVVLSNAAHSGPYVCQRERGPCILALSHSPSGPCGAQRSSCCRVES